MKIAVLVSENYIFFIVFTDLFSNKFMVFDKIKKRIKSEKSIIWLSNFICQFLGSRFERIEPILRIPLSNWSYEL